MAKNRTDTGRTDTGRLDKSRPGSSGPASSRQAKQDGLQSGAVADPIAPEQLGTAVLRPHGDFEAGSLQTFSLVYTAGKFGIDDSGSMRVCFRFASDQSRPQFEDPRGVGYTTVEASNGAVLHCRYDRKGNVRPWDRTLYIQVVHGCLHDGDTITVRFGDTSQGGPGMRLQTFCEDSFEFHVLVDPIATCNYQALPLQPEIRIVPGPPTRWVAVLPTLRRVGESFSLGLKAEDRWGNPSDKVAAELRLHANMPGRGLPETVSFKTGEFARVIEGLSVAEAGDLSIEVEGCGAERLCTAGPLRIVEDSQLLAYWGDLHGQSEETIGTNSARSYFEFARDRAFVDVAGHQGNDFQISKGLWAELNRLTAEFDEGGRFVTLPGYEWSGNTHLGGDRNVYFSGENRQIRRSSHALLADRSDAGTDAPTAAELFRAFADNHEDVVCVAHCGGRYADLKLAHDGRFERSVEIHSSWGTFEWLLHDAFEAGYRVGIVANSDGHKGRPGASYPGTSLFGAVGGLTCLLMPELSRESVFDCLRKRRHYATTGSRTLLDLRAEFAQGATLYHDDPALGPAQGYETDTATMGDIVRLSPDQDVVKLRVDVLAPAPVERLEVHNGLDCIESFRPYSEQDLGNRIRIVWEGAQYRGRFRQVVWDGELRLRANRVADARPVNFFNPEKTLDRIGDRRLAWRALSTGNFGGLDVWLQHPYAGVLEFETPLVKFELPLEEIGYEDRIFDNSSVLPRFVRVSRLPQRNPHHRACIETNIKVAAGRDNPVFVKLTQEDGHVAWSSPIYLYR